MKTILVGNGTSLLDAENGTRIDEFDNVCRFNHCKIAGFEKWTGSKTDTWFTVLQCSSKITDTLIPLSSIWNHSWERNPDKCAVHQSYAAYPWGKAKKMDHSLLGEMCEFMGDSSYKCWSTGSLAIWLMLRTEPEVVITGFDWWDREEHHYCDKAVRGTLHQPQREKAFIQKLHKQDRLHFL